VTHLAKDDLLRWRDRGEETERARVVGHLAVCDECGAVYAEMLRTRPLDEPVPVGISPETAALRARGYAARAGHARFRPRPLAAAVAFVAAGGVLLFTRGSSDRPTAGGATVRGTELVPLAPAEQAAWPLEFRWASPLAAAVYRVDVLAPGGALIHTMRTRERSAADPALRTLLEPGRRYTWTVTALREDGREVMRSQPRPFVVASAPLGSRRPPPSPAPPRPPPGAAPSRPGAGAGPRPPRRCRSR
jgi:hypothetical protein